jgi:hypothetical protein
VRTATSEARWPVPRWVGRAGAICAIGTGLFVLGDHLLSAATQPLNFDEAYNLQVPLNLYLNGRYQTWYDEPLLFPHQVTTGPTVLLPVAAAFLIFGPSHHAARAIMTAFMVGYLWQAYALSRRVAGSVGNWVFAVAAMLLAFVPLAPWLSSIVLGELPGVFLLLVGVGAMGRAATHGRRGVAFGAGVALGLAVLSKVALLMCAAGSLLALPLSSDSVGRKRESFALAAFGGLGLVLTVLAWEAVKLGVLGYAGYELHWFNFWRLMKYTGSGLSDKGIATVPSVGKHIEALATDIGRSPWQVSAGLACAAAVTVAALARQPRSFVVFSLALATFAYWTWWLRFSSWLWVRHLVPGYVVYSLLLSLVGVIVAKDARLPRTARGALLAALTLAAALTLPIGWPTAPAVSRNLHVLRRQETTAERVRSIRSSDPAAVIWGFGWYQAPDISFLSRQPFRDITRHDPSRGNQNYLLIPSFPRRAELLDYAKRHCAQYVVRHPPVALCRLGPEAPRAGGRQYRP